MKFSQKPPKEVKSISEEERQADYYKGFRSGVVLVWVFCNFALGAVVLSAAGLDRFSDDPEKADQEKNNRSMIYMAVVLWSVAGLSIFKFLGAMWYLVVRMVSSLASLFYQQTAYTDVLASSAAFNLYHFVLLYQPPSIYWRVVSLSLSLCRLSMSQR